jgi:large subunit ribosomal protein L25
MQEVSLKTEARSEFGKEAAKRYRDKKLIPVEFYSKGKENKHLLVKENELLKCLNTESRKHVIFHLDVEGKKDTSIIQDIDVHAVNGKIRHVDFMHIDMDKEYTVEIDVKLIGTSLGVKAGGNLSHQLKKCKIRCKPTFIPQHYNVDISKLEIGDNIRVGDMENENLEVVYPDSNRIIASVIKPRGIKDEELDEAIEGDETVAEGAVDNSQGDQANTEAAPKEKAE